MKANPNSWAYWHRYLRKQGELLSEFDVGKVFQLAMPFPQFQKMLFDYEYKDRKKIEQVIHHFIKTMRRRKHASPVEMYFCFCRLKFAESIARILRGSKKHPMEIIPGPSREFSREQILEWLLISLWDDHGDGEWYTTLYLTWQAALENERRNQEFASEFKKHFKISSLIVREGGLYHTQDDPDGRPLKLYHCEVRFQTGKCYRAEIPATDPPDANSIVEAFRTQRRCFIETGS
jgi:hypothetical protein